MSSRDAVINLRGTNSFSSVAQAAARDTQNLINVFRGFNAEGKAVTTNLDVMGKNVSIFNSQGRALQTTLGGISPAFRTFAGDVTASRDALNGMTPTLQQVGGAADQAGQGMNKAAGFMAKFRGVIFGGTGLLTSGIEAVGMLQNLEMSAERVSEAQDNLNRIIAEGGTGSREHANALRELANANRAYNFQQRITFLSISDMIPFTLNLVNSLSNMEGGFGRITQVIGKVATAVRNLSLAMKALLVGTGIGIALVAAGLLFEHFSQQAEATSETTSEAMAEIEKSSDSLIKSLDTDFTAMGNSMVTLEKAVAIESARIRQSIIDAFPTKGEVEAEKGPGIIDQLTTFFSGNASSARGRPGRGGGTGMVGGPEIQQNLDKTSASMKEVANVAVEVIASVEGMDAAMVNARAPLVNLQAAAADLAKEYGITTTMTDAQAIQLMKLDQELGKTVALHGSWSIEAEEVRVRIRDLVSDINSAIPSIGSLSLEVETLNSASLGLTTTFFAGIQSFDQWLQKETTAAEVTKGFTTQIDAQINSWKQNIDVTKLNLEQKKQLVQIHLAGGDVIAAYNKMLEDNTKATEKNKVEVEGWSEAVTNHMQIMDSMSTVIMTAAQASGEARKQFIEWDETTQNNILVSKDLHQRLLELAIDLGIDLPAGIQLTNEQLQQLIQGYRETGSEAAAMSQIHNEAFSSMHSEMDKMIDAATEGGKEFRDAWKGIKESIPKGQRGFFKDFFGDLGEMEEAVGILHETSAAIDLFLDITGGRLDEEMAKDFSKKFVKQLKDLKEEAEDLPYAGENIDALIDPVIAFAKVADEASEFRKINVFIEDLNKAMEGGLSDTEIQALTNAWQGFFKTFSDIVETPEQGSRSPLEVIEEAGAMLATLPTEKLADIVLPDVIEPEGIDSKLSDYRSKLQSLGTGGGSSGGGGSDSAEVEQVGGDVGKTSIFDPIVMPGPDFESEFIPGLDAGVVAVEDFNTGVQEQLSTLWEAGTEIMADFNSTIQEELTSLHEAGIEIMADFNSSVQEEISAMWEFSTEATEDMISTMQDSFDSLDTGDAVDAIEELEDAIDNLKSKTVTVTVKVKREGGSGGGGKSSGGGAGRQHGGLDFVTKPTDFTMGEHYLPEIVQVVKAGGRSLYDDMGGDVNRLINRSRSGSTIRGEVQAIRSEYMARLQNMITRVVRDITNRAVHVTIMTPDRKTLADQIIYNQFDNIGSYRGR